MAEQEKKLHIEADRWYVCWTEDRNHIELCKVRRKEIVTDDKGHRVLTWMVVTYYDGKELVVGSKYECAAWILNHWLEKEKYING